MWCFDFFLDFFAFRFLVGIGLRFYFLGLLFRYPGAKGRAIMAYGAAYKAQAAGVKHLIVPFAGSLAISAASRNASAMVVTLG